MVTQELTIQNTDSGTGKTYSKSFKDIPASTIEDAANAKGYAKSYSKIVAGTFDGGNFKQVETFGAE